MEVSGIRLCKGRELITVDTRLVACSLVTVYQILGEIFCLHPQDYSDDGRCTIPVLVSIYKAARCPNSEGYSVGATAVRTPEALWTGLILLTAHEMPATGSRRNAVDIILLCNKFVFHVENKS